jgi:hypothetical protein
MAGPEVAIILSFCAERSAVAEPTPEEAPASAWLLRLRAG